MKQKTKFLRKNFLNSPLGHQRCPESVTSKALTASGITLIALVVTIIVLLILAGVALSLISGSDGILNQATTSADQTEIAIIQEDIELAIGTMKSQYYEARYVNGKNVGTFGEYAAIQMDPATGGYQTAKGATLELDGTTLTYTKSTGETVTGTFDPDTGEAVVSGSVSAGTPAASRTYTVTYDTHGANETVSNETDVSKGTSITLPTVTKTNYVFAGWYTAATGGTKVGDAGASYTVKSNVTLHAQWVGYTVTYNTHGANGTVTNATNVASGSQITLPTVTKDNCTFKGWYDAESSGNKVGDAGASYTVTGNVTLHAQWKEIPTLSAETYTPGQEITYDGEQFFVLEDQGSTVKMLAKYCLNRAGTAQVDKTTGCEAYGRVFSSTNYWSSNFTSNPFDLQTSAMLAKIPSTDTVENNAILAAQSYGTSKNATGRLMTYEEAYAIQNGSDSNMKKILWGQWSDDTQPFEHYIYWWIGAADSADNLWMVNGRYSSSALRGGYSADISVVGVRPVLLVSET